MKMQIDVEIARMVISNAFGSPVDTNDMIVKESKTNHEVKMYNDDTLFSVSVITAKRTVDDCAKWLYSVLCSDESTGKAAFKYVHPITNAVYDDPRQVDFATLPFAA